MAVPFQRPAETETLLAIVLEAFAPGAIPEHSKSSSPARPTRPRRSSSGPTASGGSPRHEHERVRAPGSRARSARRAAGGRRTPEPDPSREADFPSAADPVGPRARPSAPTLQGGRECSLMLSAGGGDEAPRTSAPGLFVGDADL
jgi:hypothetical protein